MMSCREFWSYAVALLIAAHLFVGSLKTYRVFDWFDKLYTLGYEVAHTADDGDLYVCAAQDGKAWGAMIAYYTNEKDAAPKEVEISVQGAEQISVAVLDAARFGDTAEPLPEGNVLCIQPNTVVFLCDK